MCCVKVNKAIRLFKSVGPHASYCLVIFTTTQQCTSSSTKLSVLLNLNRWKILTQKATQQFDKLTKISMQLFSPTKANTI